MFLTQGVVGYIAKFEYYQEKVLSKLKVIGDKKQRLSNFQFKMDFENQIYYGENFDESVSEIRSDIRSERRSKMFDKDNFISTISSGKRYFDSRESQTGNKKKIEKMFIDKKYGEGIRTMRLSNGKPIPIEEFELEEDEEEDKEDEKNSVFQNQEDEDEDDLNVKSFNMTRKDINYCVSNQTKPKMIQILQIVTNTIFFLIFFLAYMIFFQSFYEDSLKNKDFVVVSSSYRKLIEFERILKNINDLYCINVGIYDGLNGITEKELRIVIQANLNSLNEYQLILTQNSNDISEDLNSLLVNQNIKMNFTSTISQKFSLNEATQQMISKILNLLNSNISSFNNDNSDFVFVNINMNADFLEALKQACNYYYEKLLSKSQKKNTLLIIFVASGIILFIGCIVSIIIKNKLQRNNEKMLSLFLFIKEEDVRKMYSKNEVFLSYLQTGDDQEEDFSENDDDLPEHANIGNKFDSKNKKRKFKNIKRTSYKLISILIIIALSLEFFFIFSYVVSYNMSNNLPKIMNFFELTNIAEFEFLYAFNCQQSLLRNNHNFIQNADLMNKCNQSISKIYDFQSNYNYVSLIK